MSINDFINFNNTCPICNNKLTLYMQIDSFACFKGKFVNGNYYFTQFYYKDDRIAEDDKIIMSLHDSKFRIVSSKSIREILENNIFFLFYLCNDKGFVKEVGDYHISLYQGCYHRSSPDLKLENNIVTLCNEKITEQNANESFNIVSMDHDENIEEVFGLSMNYAENLTDFYFYSSSREERDKDDFEPKIFEKHMPLLPTRPSFSLEGKERLIQKMKSWIFMS